MAQARRDLPAHYAGYMLGHEVRFLAFGGLAISRDDGAYRVGRPDPSPDGWDSEMMAYPAVVRWRDRVYLFYNGNDYGRSGFGHAERLRW